MVNSCLQEIMDKFQGDDALDQLPTCHDAWHGDPRAHDDDNEDDENEIYDHLHFNLLHALLSLKILDLSSNQLQESMPSNLFELSQLRIID